MNQVEVEVAVGSEVEVGDTEAHVTHQVEVVVLAGFSQSRVSLCGSLVALLNRGSSSSTIHSSSQTHQQNQAVRLPLMVTDVCVIEMVSDAPHIRITPIPGCR